MGNNIITCIMVNIKNIYKVGSALLMIVHERFKLHILRHWHLCQLLLCNRIVILFHIHTVLWFSGTIYTSLARTLISTHDASCKAGTILLIAFSFLASTENFLLLLDLRREILEKYVLLLYASLAAKILNTKFIFSLETGTGLPFTVLVAYTGMIDIVSILLWFSLV